MKLTGTPPHMKGIDMSKDPYCAKQHEGDPAKMENVMVGANGGLQNVVLYITQGLQGSEASAVPSEEPTFDQKGCMYSPHVLVVNSNQKFKVTTGDQTTHNIHPLPAPGSGNIGWNKSQPPGAPPIETDWKAPEAISVKCNIHPWMHGWHVVVKGPYAISDASGNYTIKNLPSGLVHRHRVAGGVRNSDPDRDSGSRSTWQSRLHLQSKVTSSRVRCSPGAAPVAPGRQINRLERG